MFKEKNFDESGNLIIPKDAFKNEQKWKLSMSWVICIICSSFANSLPHESQDFIDELNRVVIE